MESLVGLRAEVQRKRQEQQERAASAAQQPTQRLKIKKGDRATVVVESSTVGAPNRGVLERDTRDRELAEEEKYTEEKARCVLEQKAALYDRLHGGVAALENDTLNNTFLVNFQKKIVDNVLESKRREAEKKTVKKGKEGKSGKKEDEYDDWVEYVDAFGRTREVRQSEVAGLKEQDKYIKDDEEDNQEETLATAGLGTDEAVAEQQEEFEEQFRDQQRKRWEQQEELNAVKKDVHYQDVMFDEARTHGAAFVRLSGDTEVRREQQTLLRELHASSDAAAAQHKAHQKSRNKSMALRLEKIRQRKRLKLGLPMTGSYDRLKTPPQSDDEEDKEAPKDGSEDCPGDIPAKRPDAKVREWDVGKQVIGKFVEPSDKDPDAFLVRNPLGGPVELSQEGWLARQRLQRNEDFAPPSAYQDSAAGSSSNRTKSANQFGYDRKREGSVSSRSRFNDEDRLQRQYNKEARGNCSSYDITNECEDGYKDTSSSLSSQCDVSPNRFINKSKRAGAAIPPPTSFEYYGPPDKKRQKGPLFDPIKKMEDAISKGLAQLKNLS